MASKPCFADTHSCAMSPRWRGRAPDRTLTLVAYVRARDGASSGLIDELKALMRAAPPPMRPARFYLEPSIPRLPSSKLDIRALAALDEAHVHRERGESIDEAALTAIAGDDHVSADGGSYLERCVARAGSLT